MTGIYTNKYLMPLENWFPTPIFVHDFEDPELSEIQAEISSVIPTARSCHQASPWGDSVETTFDFKGTNDIKRFEMPVLLSKINWTVQKYVNSLHYQGPAFALTESWFNFSKTNGFQFDHTHAGSRISGVYYYQTSNSDGNIRFQNPNPFVHFRGFPADDIPSESISYKSKNGRLILFPSWLTHRVNKNLTTIERISISFNLT
jgi:uncharacterized protein (TIGR02466 family)